MYSRRPKTQRAVPPKQQPTQKHRDLPKPTPKPTATPPKSCLKSASSTARKYLGRDPGGIYCTSSNPSSSFPLFIGRVLTIIADQNSQEAENGVPRREFIKKQRVVQVERYEMRVAQEDASANVPRPVSAPSKPTPSSRDVAVRFTGETTYIFQPDRILAKPSDFEVVGFAVSKLTEYGIRPCGCRFRRPLYA